MANNVDAQYRDLCLQILSEGERRDDRTGTGTLSIFGHQMRFDLTQGFPLLTTKRLPFRIIFEELRWFLMGDTDIKHLLDQNVNIWNADAYRDYCEKCASNKPAYDYDHFVLEASELGYDLGPIYGAQWRSWTSAKTSEFGYAGLTLEQNYTETIDQIAQVVESIRTNPQSRRHIVSAWNPGELDEMALPPCHVMFQFYVANGKLSCQLYQRSADVFLGLPFNIASYALLTHIIADMTGYFPGELIHTLGDAHIYTNHIEQVREQLTREPKELPSLHLYGEGYYEDPADYTWDDVELVGYDPHPAIKGEVSVGLNQGDKPKRER